MGAGGDAKVKALVIPFAKFQWDEALKGGIQVCTTLAVLHRSHVHALRVVQSDLILTGMQHGARRTTSLGLAQTGQLSACACQPVRHAPKEAWNPAPRLKPHACRCWT